MRLRTVMLRRGGLAAGLLAIASLVGCAGETPEPATKRLVILTNAVAPFWDAADAGAKQADKQFKLGEAGLRVDFVKNTKGTEGQIDKLRQYAGAVDIAGIAVSVSDAGNSALIDEMRKLQKSGVKIITVDSDVDRSKARDARFAYIGTDNIIGGRELGRCAKGLMPDGGKYASFVGYKTQGNAIERDQGFAEGAGPEFQQVAYLGDEVDEVTARKNVRDALNNHPETNLLVGIWSYNTPAIVDVVKDQKIRDRMTVVGFDADPPSIRAMGEGNVDALVVQNPYDMGYQCVRLLKALVEDDQKVVDEMFPNRETDQELGDVYTTGLKVVVPDESSPLKPEMFEENTQFLTLQEFRDWLNEYGLTGS